jgi:putative endonuclease
MKLNDKAGSTNKVGGWGEDIAVSYIMKQRFMVLERNYNKKCGEIDIIAYKIGSTDATIHFIEVKTVSYKTAAQCRAAVSRDTWQPEMMLTAHKLLKLQRVIEVWCHEKHYDGDWQIDAVIVKVVPHEKFATAKYLPNII